MSTASAQARPVPAYGVPTIIVAQFVPTFLAGGITLALPPMGVDLQAGASALGLVESLYLAGTVAMLLPSGRLCDATDKATLYKYGMLAFALTTALIGVLSSVPLILFLRLIEGMCAALVAVAGPALLSEFVPPERRGRVFGLMLSSVYAGLTLGPVATGWLVDHWGWRGAFLGCGAAIFVAFLLAVRLPATWRRPARDALHVPSTLLLVLAMVVLVIGAAGLNYGLAGWSVLAVGVLLAGVFVAWQTRLAAPVLDVPLLVENPGLSRALLVQVLVYVNPMCMAFFMTLYIQVTRDQSAQFAGHLLAFGSVVMICIAPQAGALADRVRPAVIATTGVAFTAAGAAIAAFLDETSSMTQVMAALVIQSIGFALFSSPNLTMVMNSVSREKSSTAAALTAKARSLGMLAGMTISAALVAIFLGNAPVEREPLGILRPMTLGFTIMALLTGAGVFIGSRGRRIGQQTAEAARR